MAKRKPSDSVLDKLSKVNCENLKLNNLAFTASRVTYGGRSLNAIWRNPKLKTYHKVILNILASYCDFQELDQFGSFRDQTVSMSIRRICYEGSFTIPTCTKHTDELVEMGYVIKDQKFDEETKSYLETHYRITDKILIEYYVILGIDLEKVTEKSDVPKEGAKQDLAPLLNDVENKENNTEIRKNSISSKDEIDQKKSDCENCLLKKKNTKSKPKAAKRPQVTDTHRKAARIFAPDIKYVKNTYWDKSSLFMIVDETIEKYGDMAHSAIEDYYNWCKKNGELGKYPWSAQSAENSIEAVIKEYSLKTKKDQNHEL